MVKSVPSGRYFGLLFSGLFLLSLWPMSSFAAITYPFCDDMENTGSGNWIFQPPWDYTAETSHSGSRCITDSPHASYGNNVDVACTLSSDLDLTAAQHPVLSFWQKYATEAYSDLGIVELSTDSGASWATLGVSTGRQDAWVEARFDLTPYAGQNNLRLRFRFVSNGAITDDGWYIDDVCVQESPTPVLPFPFSDDMEGGALTAANWLAGDWVLSTDEAHSPTHSWVATGNYYGYAECLTTSGTIDLSSASCPRLVFWSILPGSYAYVEVSSDGGRNWTTATVLSQHTAWERQEVDLAPYRSPLFRLRFQFPGSSPYVSMYVDDVRVEEGSCDLVDWCSLEAPDSIRVGINSETPPITGLVFESGVTDSPGQGGGLSAQVGYGPDGSNPAAWPDSQWVVAAYQDDDSTGTRDRYAGSFAVLHEGTYDYAFRFKYPSDGSWTYGDLDGNDLGSEGENGYSSNEAGNLVVRGVPHIAVFPEHYAWTVGQGDTTTAVLEIRNVGDAPVSFQILEAPAYGADRPGPPGYASLHLASESLSSRQAAHSLWIRRAEERWDIPWISEDPTEGQVAPADTSGVSLRIAPGSLPVGPQSAYLIILNNDPDHNPVVVTVDLNVTPSAIAAETLPKAFVWTAPWPVPSQDVVHFRYGLPSGAAVTLQIFDVAGRLVSEPVNGTVGGGYNELRWRAPDPRAGVFFYRFRTGEILRTGRIIMTE